MGSSKIFLRAYSALKISFVGASFNFIDEKKYFMTFLHLRCTMDGWKEFLKRLNSFLSDVMSSFLSVKKFRFLFFFFSFLIILKELNESIYIMFLPIYEIEGVTVD